MGLQLFKDYPSYELFTETLRKGIFVGRGREEDGRGRQLRLVVGTDRRVKEVHRI